VVFGYVDCSEVCNVDKNKLLHSRVVIPTEYPQFDKGSPQEDQAEGSFICASDSPGFSLLKVKKNYHSITIFL